LTKSPIGLLSAPKSGHFKPFFMCNLGSTKKAGAEQFSGYSTPTIDKEPLISNGAYSRNRTTDTGIFSPLLYQLS
jgi:hypothetical protein